MIKSLNIKNFILVEEINIGFEPGLNIITGETGAGKSLLVNAIAQLCGERSSADLVRSGSARAIIEAQLQLDPTPELKRLIQKLELEIADFNLVILRKEISANGGSRIFINDSPATLSQLTEFSDLLVDLHGQHQHQRLLHAENHIHYLDEFADLAPAVGEFSALLNQFKTALKNRDELQEKQRRAVQMQDMYRYQYSELSNANLDEDELDRLKYEQKILANVETLHQYGRALTEAMYSGEINASFLLAKAETNLMKLAELDSQFADLQSSLSGAQATIEEIGRFTEEYLTRLQFSPDRLEQIQQRIAQQEFLLKKYQKLTIAELIGLHEEMGSIIASADHFEDELAKAEKQIAVLAEKVVEKGRRLSDERKHAATVFQQKITSTLEEVGMPNAQFQTRQTFHENEHSLFAVNGKKLNANENGFDEIIFEIASNVGESYKLLHKIASGGEISRLMLAIKTVLAQADKIPSLVFDEIDAGISGKVAQIVGRKLADLAQYHQIICITHLPQIAAFADAHYKVVKFIEDGRTFVDICSLDESTKVTEIANLLGGQEVSQHALENARFLISEAKKTQSD